MSSERVRLTSIGVLITEPRIRSAAVRMSSIVGGCIIAARPSPSPGGEQCYAAAHPSDAWLIGFGWNQEFWPDKRFPTTADLDAVVADRPVVLERVDGHALVANSAAMKAAGVTSASRSPAGGNIINGLFVDNARSLIDKAIPAPNQQQMDLALAKAQEILLGFGVTGVGSMSTSLDDCKTFRRPGDSGHLQVRLMAYLLGPEALTRVHHPHCPRHGD